MRSYITNRLVVYVSESDKCMRLAQALGGAHRIIIRKMNDYSFELQPNDIPILRGMWDDHIDRYIYFAENQIPYIAVDNGYFFRNHYGKDFYRMTWNQHQATKFFPCKPDRWLRLKQESGIEIHPWKKNINGPIVICLAPAQPTKYYNLKIWLDETQNLIRRQTDREIIIREKPRGRALNLENFHTAIEDAYCVVTHTSIAAVDAVLYGIPVVVSPLSCASHVGCTKLSDIDNLSYPDRQPWLNWLAYSQFSYREMHRGTAIRELITQRDVK